MLPLKRVAWGAWLQAQDGECLIHRLWARTFQYAVHWAESLQFCVLDLASVMAGSAGIQRNTLKCSPVRTDDQGIRLLSHAVMDCGPLCLGQGGANEEADPEGTVPGLHDAWRPWCCIATCGLGGIEPRQSL
ncbi:hypothetical protein NDU88_005906 [Pleurodeles waltl]|uniref:Uncharacterized protein n=1 Tax=Pleurodeles waltl TaxID=8319 RepID=A0AAV7TDZ9_PLEWA|nr:hypothetical protein NDU88_005906 [Pleurodeles waltl]